jgi:hypothetical protein
MSAIITIFKIDLNKHHGLSAQLSSLSRESKELEEGCVYCPSPGMLVRFINLLRQAGVPYGIHYKPDFENENFDGSGKLSI